MNKSATIKNEVSSLLYHHCAPVDFVYEQTIKPDRLLSEPSFLKAYEWVERVVGFYPLFLAVGSQNMIPMTGYQDNWRVWTGGDFVEGIYKKHYRRKGEFPNLAVFSFDNLDGVFMDYDSWHIALNAFLNGNSVSDYQRRMIFKPSWTRTRRICATLTGSHAVQAIVPELNLRKAKRILVRNRATKKIIENLGFRNVNIRRIKVEKL